MPDTSTKVIVNCDICGDAMSEQAAGFACFPCKNFIPEGQLYRYAAHVFIQCDTCGDVDESGFINDEGNCMDCEGVQSGN